jgi:RES domain-containing protein
MRLYRITGKRFKTTAAAFSGLGVALAHGRWNRLRPDLRGVYCADSLALSCLETLVHIETRPRVFPPSVYYVVDVPDALIEHPTVASLPAGWKNDIPCGATQDYGTAFLVSQRAVGVAVPTVVQDVGTNVLLNPLHPAFKLTWVSGPFAYKYDARLA